MEPALAAILDAPPDPERPYVYRGTSCHINKFGILNPDALERVVRCTTALRTEMLLADPIDGSFDLAHLRAIHRFLFQDVYDWAGEIRIVDFHQNEKLVEDLEGVIEEEDRLPVGLGKASQFSKSAHIAADCERLFGKLRDDNYLRGLSAEAFVERGVRFLSSLFLIHPFRDGNGRSTRIFLGQLAASAGWRLDFEGIPQARRHLSAYQSHCGDHSALSKVFRQALRGEIEPTSFCDAATGTKVAGQRQR